MKRILSDHRGGKILLSVCATISLLMACAYAQDAPTVKLTEISSDPFTVPPGQHATEVEPHVLANGLTLVSAFQTGRIAPGGATAIGWATSTDGGGTWAHGFLPGLTTGNGGGLYSAASDPAVAYDAKHGVWMIASLPISDTSETPAVVVNRSTDGGFTWDNPVNVGAKRYKFRQELDRVRQHIDQSLLRQLLRRVGQSRQRRRDFYEHFKRWRPDLGPGDADRKSDIRDRRPTLSAAQWHSDCAH